MSSTFPSGPAPSHSTLKGLSLAEVRERNLHGKRNTTDHRPSQTVRQIVHTNIFTRFNAILGTLLVITLILNPLQDAVFGIVLVANALIGIVQELRAKHTLDRLTMLVMPKAQVLRSSALVEIPIEEIVLDDIIYVRAGDQFPVDGIVLASEGVETDDALLTGESDPQTKKIGTEVLSGAFVVSGSAYIQATRVGADSYANRLTEEARQYQQTQSELRTGIDQILRYVTYAIFPCAALLIISQTRTYDTLEDAAAGTIAGIVAMVPEGLVLLTSMTLAIAVIRLGNRKTLVRELSAVEALARTDTLCLDKTGTLTQGGIIFDDLVFLPSTTKEERPAWQIESQETLPSPSFCATYASSGSNPGTASGTKHSSTNRYLDIPTRDKQVHHALGALAAADPSPNASMKAIANTFVTPEGGDWKPQVISPFSSTRKWNGISFANGETWVLGAPEIVGRLSHEHTTRELAHAAQDLANTGKRVLLLALSQNQLEPGKLPEKLLPQAFILLSERLRKDAKKTLEYFGTQDVTIKVISGDNPHTVAAIAQQVGTPGLDTAQGKTEIDAQQYQDTPQKLATLANEHVIFGRVTPREKQIMIRGLQKHEHTVAMIGDGVNDILALKEADLGIAMGNGANAAKAVSQLILLDNRFETLPYVVAEGRRVIANVERVATLFITKTIYSIVLTLIVSAMMTPFPFLPRHLTIVGSLSVGIPAFVLSFAPNNRRVQPNFTQRILPVTIPAGIIAALVTLVVYFYSEAHETVPLIQARTAATITLTCMGFSVLRIISQPLNLVRIFLLTSMIACLGATLVIPILANFYALESPPQNVWLVMAAALIIGNIALKFAYHLTQRHTETRLPSVPI